MTLVVPYPAFVAHIFFAMLLSGLVVLHVLAAFYHQFVRRDGLFRRMSFGRRVRSGGIILPEQRPLRCERVTAGLG